MRKTTATLETRWLRPAELEDYPLSSTGRKLANSSEKSQRRKAEGMIVELLAIRPSVHPASAFASSCFAPTVHPPRCRCRGWPSAFRRRASPARRPLRAARRPAGCGCRSRPPRCGPAESARRSRNVCSRSVSKRAQIAVVDAHQPGADAQHAGQIGRLVQFDQRRHAQFENRVVQSLQQVVVETFGDQQHGVGPGRPGLDHLVRVDNKILPQHGQIDRRADLAQDTPSCLENTADRSTR